MKSWRSLVLAAVVCGGVMTIPSEAQAGPLLDWLRGLRQKCRLNNNGCNTCQSGVASNALVQASPYNLQPGQCATTCNQTCSRTVVNYVPYTAYRCSYEQVPVTQYKPVTSSDPCTGCSVTCMKPCTTYTWQMKQVPYTTYRAVYRNENYTVPVTTISNSDGCSTCGVNPQAAVSGCPTCTVPGNTLIAPTTVPPAGVPQGTIPVYGAPQPGATYPYPAPGNVLPGNAGAMVAPNGTISTTGSYSAFPGDTYTNGPTPADSVPSIDGVNPNTMQRPILDSLRGYNDSTQISPARSFQRDGFMTGGVTLDQVSLRNATRREWGYTPVRLASHAKPVVQETDDQPKTRWTVSANVAGPGEIVHGQNQDRVNSSWRAAGW